MINASMIRDSWCHCGRFYDFLARAVYLEVQNSDMLVTLIPITIKILIQIPILNKDNIIIVK